MKSAKTEPVYLTREEVAERLRISTRILDKLVAAGELIGARIGGRLLFRVEDVERYFERRLGNGHRISPGYSKKLDKLFELYRKHVGSLFADIKRCVG